MRVTIKSINLLVLVEASVIKYLYIGLVEDILGFWGSTRIVLVIELDL